MNQSIKPGMRIINGATECTVLLFTENGRRNLAMLIRSDDGMFVTVRNLSIFEGHATYSWDWGHYFTDIREAIKDYNKRFNEL
jgi:hypothetical protein